ncbi:MAG TPA: signal peptidase I [Blastocatellia bacterium]|nr:signal peptidase I [Blastocatellia bacterium]
MSKIKKSLLVASIVIIIGVVITSIYAFLSFRLIRVPTGTMSNTILPGDRLIIKRHSGPVERGDIITFLYPGDPSVEYLKRVVGLPGEKIEIRGSNVLINDKILPEQKVWVQLPTDEKEPLIPDSDRGPTIPSEEDYKNFYSGVPYRKYKTYYFSQGYDQNGQKPGSPSTSDAQPRPCPFKREALEANPNLIYPTFGVEGQPCIIQPGQYFTLGDSRDGSQDSRFYGTVPQENITGKPVLIYLSTARDKSGNEVPRHERSMTRIDQ